MTVSVSIRRQEGVATVLVTGNFDLAAAKFAAWATGQAITAPDGVISSRPADPAAGRIDHDVAAGGLPVGPVMPMRVEPACRPRPRPADDAGEEPVDQRAYGTG